MAAVPQATVGPVPHDREGTLGCHLSFKLGEDHDELHHRFAGRHRRVELLPQAADVDIVFGKECPQVNEVFQAPSDAVELEADDQINFARCNIAFQPLKLRAVLVFRALAGIDVKFERSDLQVLAAFAELDLLLDLMLLCDEAIALGRLTLL